MQHHRTGMHLFKDITITVKKKRKEGIRFSRYKKINITTKYGMPIQEKKKQEEEEET